MFVKMEREPYIIEFQKIGNPSEGYISVAQFKDLIPFKVKRTFWTYFTPENLTRGRHSHYKTDQVLIAVTGKITVSTEMPNGDKANFVLESPCKGVFLPSSAWHVMNYSHNAVQLVFASTIYDKKDYIRDYKKFKKNS
tara:strand:+ start:378 stop:791 length:414 start_codon:yes stop_codon:yes gene_type:complete